MKKTKKILSLILLVVLAMSLVGCGKKDTSDQLIGTWALTFNYAPLIEEDLVSLDSMYLDFHEKFDITTKLTFNADGTFSWVVDEEALSATWDTYVKSLAQFDADYVYDQYEAEGYTTQDAEDYFQEQYGMSVYDAVYEDWLNNFYTLEDISGGFSISGVYEARGDEVHMDEREVQDNVFDVFTVVGDTLTLNPPPGAEDESSGIEGFDYPYVFTRVAE